MLSLKFFLGLTFIFPLFNSYYDNTPKYKAKKNKHQGGFKLLNLNRDTPPRGCKASRLYLINLCYILQLTYSKASAEYNLVF